MTCCKADEYGGWCKDLNSNPSPDSLEYCNFHAPAKYKRGNINEFNGKIFEHIQQAIDSEQACDLSGTIFPGQISFTQFDKDRPLPPVNFSRTVFTDDAHFINSTFSGKANFEFSTFSGKANFRSSTFSDKADFESSTFSDGAFFNGSTFSGDAFFWLSTFSGDAYFEGSTFSGEAVFRFSTFRGAAFFNGSTFSGKADFRSSTFSGMLFFSNSTFSGEIVFENTMFEKDAIFTRLKIDTAKVLLFREVDFADSSATFLETDLTLVRFDRCLWPQKKVLGLAQLGTSDVLPDETKADRYFWQASLKEKIFNYPKYSRHYEMVGELYRQLKQQYKERHNEAEASKWHYREKEMFRKKGLFRRFLPSTTNLYWIFSGYGESPGQAGMLLLALLTGLIVLMNAFGLVAFPGKEIGEISNIQGVSFPINWIKFRILIETVVQHALFVKEPYYKAATSGGATIFLVFTRLVIPIQAALFAFALRNKFRR